MKRPARHGSEAFGSANIEPTADSRLRRLFQEHHASVWRLLRRLNVPQSQLDDAVQEVFWVAARRIDDIVPGREQSFLYGVALRIGANYRRREGALRSVPSDCLALIADESPSPETLVGRRKAREMLDDVLDQMPLEMRSIFILCVLEELHVREAAEIEGIPVGTASSRLRRARQEYSAIVRRIQLSLRARKGLG